MKAIYEKDGFSAGDAENIRRRLLEFFRFNHKNSGLTLLQVQDLFSHLYNATKLSDRVLVRFLVFGGQRHLIHQIDVEVFKGALEVEKIIFHIQLPKPLSESEVLRLQNILLRPSREQLMKKIEADKEDLELKNRRISELNNVLETAMYNALVSVASLRDNETGEHLLRTSTLGRELAERFWKQNSNITEHYEGKTIELAIPLHDIGKVGISDAILLKPDKLTTAEFEVMKGHSNLGADLIERFRIENNLEHDRVLRMAQCIAQSHHENFDGTGYPNGLVGLEIPFEARIMAIVDVYDALRSKRPYKEAMSKTDAFDEMIRVSKKKFDPEIFRIFLEMESEKHEPAEAAINARGSS